MFLSISRKISILSVFLVAVTAGVVGMVFYNNTKQVLVERELEKLSTNALQHAARLEHKVHTLQEDVIFLAGTPPIEGIIRARKSQGMDTLGASTEQQWRSRLTTIFSTLLYAKPDYLQVRFIAANGAELVRVERKAENVLATPSLDLQDKSGRDYVVETLKLREGQVYLSDINLNREFGRIVEPHQPVMRAATPVYGADGNVSGLIVINLDVSHELSRIQEHYVEQRQTIYVTDHLGSYLLHPDDEMLFGADFSNSNRIQNEFPQSSGFFQSGVKSNTLSIISGEAGKESVMVLTRLAYDKLNTRHYITVGLSFPFSAVTARQEAVMADSASWAVGLVIIGALLALSFSSLLVKPLRTVINGIQGFMDGKEVESLPIEREDELGVLARAFTALMGKVRNSEAELNAMNLSLEEQISQRTEELTRFKTTLDQTIDCVFMFEPGSLKFFYANAGAMAQVGYSNDELMNMTPIDIKPDIDEQQFRLMIAPIISGEAPALNFEVIHQHKDGHRIPVDIFLQYIDVPGQSARFVAIVRDVSERKAAETALQDAETRQRTILETVVDGIITIDDHGIVQSYNMAAEKIFGYQAKEVIGENVNMLMPEPFAHEHDGYLKNYNETGEAKIIGIGREVVGKREDGSTFPMDLAVSNMWLGGKHFYAGIVRDITERKRIESMKNEFISTVSHELRTPLTSIRGSLGLVTGGAVGKLPSKVKSMLTIASNNTERLLLLINDILDIQKLESGELAFRFESLSVMTLLEQAIADLSSFADQHGIHFVIKKRVEDAYAFADYDRLMQVMFNLMSNAAKFSPEGSEVELSVVQHHGDRLRISVSDSGPGIPQEFHDKVFQRFTQSDSSDTRSKGGTGLGLAISKVIIEKHGGRIDFISNEGIGTTFYLELPLLLVDAENEMKFPDTAMSTQQASVLIVEDDRDIAVLIQRMLAEAGYNSDIAFNARQARQLVAEKGSSYRLMTLDIVLPDEDGISLLHSLREDAKTHNLPVVVISVKANEARREINGGAIGILDWLYKPIDQKRLVEIVRQVAGKGNLPRVLHVEDEPDVHQVVSMMLKKKCELVWTTTLDDSRKVLESETFDLVLLDVCLPDGNGLDLLNTIEQCPKKPRVVIFSAQDVSREYADKVSAVLVKSESSNAELLDIMLEVMRN